MLRFYKYLAVLILGIIGVGFYVKPMVFGKKAQLALVVDFSKSSETVIQSLVSNYWEIYTEFNAKHPDVELELAIVGYSKRAFGSKNKYVKVLSTFKNSPEKAFEYLVSNELGSSVAENNVGFALSQTLSELSWDKDEAVKKQIITIGNGPIKDSYSLAKRVCSKAKKQNIMVNSLYVLYKQNDKNHSYWMALTEMAGGELKTVVPKFLIGGATAYRTAENDMKIISENDALKSTYVYFGEKGKQMKEKVYLLDSLSGESGIKTLASRVEFKASNYYQGKNSDWDLIEYFSKHGKSMDKIRAEAPADLRKLGDKQLKSELEFRLMERKSSIQIINMLTKANEQINSGFPDPPAYKRDISETILTLLDKGGF